MGGWDIKDVPAGVLPDVASSLDDIVVLYRKKGVGKVKFTDPNEVEDKLAADAEEATKGLDGDETKADTQEEGNLEDKLPANARSDTKPPKKWQEDSMASELYHSILHTLRSMEVSKVESKNGRNTWQTRQRGGEGEPFYKDATGFEEALQMTVEHGRRVYAEKWGHKGCDLMDVGLKAEDAWRVEHDW